MGTSYIYHGPSCIGKKPNPPPPPNKKKESYLKHPCQRLRNPFLLSLSPDYLSTPPPQKKKGKMNFFPHTEKNPHLRHSQSQRTPALKGAKNWLTNSEILHEWILAAKKSRVVRKVHCFCWKVPTVQKSGDITTWHVWNPRNNGTFTYIHHQQYLLEVWFWCISFFSSPIREWCADKEKMWIFWGTVDGRNPAPPEMYKTRRK